MLIDTGAGSSLLRPEVARALNLKPEYRVTEVTTAGERVVPGAKSISVEVAGRTENGIEFLWAESSGLADAAAGLDGVLGQSFLSRFDYLLDYGSRRFAIEPEEAPGRKMSFVLAAGRILLSAMSPEEGNIRLILDSGASHVLLWRNLSPGASSAPTALIATNGPRSANLIRIPVLVVGGHALSSLDALVVPRSGARGVEDGLLPAGLFRTVYVSNSGGYVKLAR